MRRLILAFTLDLIYLVGAVLSLILATLRGRPGRVWDHLLRRTIKAPGRRSGDRPCFWLHGVSVGEVLAARQLVHRLREEFPSWDFVVSSSTRLGQESAKKHFPAQQVISFPLDFSWIVRRSLRRIRPRIVAIVEHDLWPNFSNEVHAMGASMAIVNARLSPRSLRGYRRLSRVYPWPPRNLAAICLQDDVSRSRFESLGYSAAILHSTGNLKFDNPPPSGTDGLREALGFDESDWIFVAGSTHEGEETAALDAFQRLRAVEPNSYLVLAPRRIERTDEVLQLVKSRGLSCDLWSCAPKRDAAVILVDTMGELAKLVALGSVVFVGGSLVPVGGHSVIEPASLGKAIILGPHYFNAKSIVRDFLDRDGLIVVEGAEELTREILSLHADPERRFQLGERAANVVHENLGATERTVDALRPLFDA